MNEREMLKRLAMPFDEADVEWRIARSGKSGGGKIWAMCLAYITNRAILNRLDEVFGLYGWQNEFKSGPQGGVICGIKFRNHETGEWITRWDGADNTLVEEIKGGLSGAMKRAGSQLGIGRYLYNLTENFAQIADRRSPATPFKAKLKDGTWFWWGPPALPEWALPVKEEEPVEVAPVTPAESPAPKEIVVESIKEIRTMLEESPPVEREKPHHTQVKKMMALAKQLGSDGKVRSWLETEHPNKEQVKRAIAKMEGQLHGTP